MGPSGYEATVGECSFVLSDGTRKTGDREIQRKIRANAMRDYWRRRKLETKSKPDHRSKQSGNVDFETDACELGAESSEKVWWWEGEQRKLAPRLVEAGVEAKDCSSRYAAKKRAAEYHLLLPHPATQSAHATLPQRRNFSKKCDNEGESRNGSSTAIVSIGIGNSMADPFNASALEGNRHDSFLLSNLVAITDYTPKRRGFFSKLWLPTAIQDPTLLWSTLTFATIWLDLLGLQYDGFRPLSYRARAIDNLNKSLRSPRTALSDSSIAAVAMFAIMAGYLGNYEELKIHCSALQKMIGSRGGPQSLQSFPGLQALLAWYNFHCSNYFRLNLMYPSIVSEPSPDISDLTVWSTYLYGDNLSFPLSPGTDLGQLHERRRDVSAVFRYMRHLALAVESESQKPGIRPLSYVKADLLDFDTMRKALEHRLLLLEPDEVATDMTLADYALEISRLAALLYLQYAVPKRVPDRSRVQSLRVQIVEHLRCMEDTYATVDTAAFQAGIWLWAHFIASKIPWDDGEGADEIWMTERLARVVRAAGISTWAEMERHLRRVCWMDLSHTPDCKRLWERVQRINKRYWTEKLLSMQEE